METKITQQQIVSVTNRNNGFTGYTLSDGTFRNFAIGQTRKVDLNELKELRDSEGGEYILKHYLIINDKNALEYLDLNPEPEYFYTEKEIKELLTNGSLDQLEDALNFAPQGVIDIIKDMSVKMQLPDVRKRDLIFKKTGFNVTNAITVNAVLDTPTEEVEETAPKRKAAPIEAQTTETVRKATPIKTEKYKRVTE